MNIVTPSSSLLANQTNVFEDGNYKTVLFNVQPDSSIADGAPPPKPLLIGSPSEGGDFPVLLLLHGYLLRNYFYSQLIQHVASHGFIVVAPQLYTLAGPDSSDEIKYVAALIEWLPRGLLAVLPGNIRPNIAKLALSGHSRGGKAAFALALKKVAASPVKISALIGIDPVDGMDKGKQTPPPVLTYVPHSFDLDHMPVMVIGSGLGSVKRNPLFPACAPEGVNHVDFYDECQSPAWYFVVKDYGHLDMLDDDTKGMVGKSTYCLCKNGKSREPMRRFVGGAVVAFLKGYLEGDDRDLIAIRDGQEAAPVLFDKVEFRE
ncbi:Chlorophyllase-2 [Ancistrocladus abbreviatus]